MGKKFCLEKGEVSFWNDRLEVTTTQYAHHWYENIYAEVDDDGNITVTATERQTVGRNQLESYSDEEIATQFVETPKKITKKFLGMIPFRKWDKDRYMLNATTKRTFHCRTGKWTVQEDI